MSIENSAFDVSSIEGLKELWKETTGSIDICIAVIDDGIDLGHDCFKGATITNYPANENCRGAGWHGTQVSSIIWGRHTSRVQGIAPGCKGIVIQIYREEDGKTIPCSQLDLARAIQKAAESGANIINISGGQFSSFSDGADSILTQTIRDCTKEGILIVAAVGNDGCDCLHIPAADPEVLAVGAMDERGEPLDFSNFGKAYKTNGLLFPGKEILTAAPNNGIITKTGTSFATPVASGIVALLASLQVKYNKKIDCRSIFKSLLAHATPCLSSDVSCNKILAGRVNLKETFFHLLSSCKNNYQEQEIKKSGLREGDFFNFNTTNNNKEQIFSSNSNNITLITPKMNTTNLEQTNDDLISGIEMNDLTLSEPVSEEVMPAGVEPSDCGCNKEQSGKPQGAQLVYAIGELGIEFKSIANRDSFKQLLDGASPDPNDPIQLLNFLDKDPEASEGIIWTLNLDSTPVYAIIPNGGFAPEVYTLLRKFYREQIQDGVQRISVPGVITGKIQLLSGQEVPVLTPKGYGIYSWSTSDLVEAVAGKEPAEANLKAAYSLKTEVIYNFLDRVYYDLRNLGVSSKDRAINFAATNAFQVEDVFSKAINEELELQAIDVERSPVSRPNSDCWDVKLTFFNPKKRLEQARKVYRFTIDVSYVIPVTVGKIRSWNIF